MFAITPVVLLILAVTGGGVAAVANSKAQNHNIDKTIEAVQPEEAAPESSLEQSDDFSAIVTVNGFPVYTFTSCAKAQTKAVELQEQTPDMQIRPVCNVSSSAVSQTASGQ